MSPLQTSVNLIGRGLASFHPASMPALSRAHYRREIFAWPLLAVMLSAVEGGVVGVLAKHGFSGVAEPWLVNLAAAVLTGAPPLANVVSFLWAALSRGRHKIRFLNALQIAVAVLVTCIALAPRSMAGLVMVTLLAIAARMCWSGVVTLRATVWRANYPRRERARMAGKITTLQVLVVAVVGLGLGLAMEADEQAFRLVYPIAAVVGLGGSMVYGRMRVRGHRVLVKAERAEAEETAGRVAARVDERPRPRRMRGMRGSRLALAWRVLHEDFVGVLRDDPLYRRYMLCMFIFGFGNLMVTAPLLVMLADRFGFSELQSVLILSSIPMAMVPFSIPLWARLLDRMHIVRYRLLHSWSFTTATVVFLLGGLLMSAPLLYVAALVRGIGFGGGMLGWNLGHHDFAPAHRASQYMGVHVTLTGVRGLIAPIVGVKLYMWLDGWAMWPGGAGPWVFAACVVLNLAGAYGFWSLARRMKRIHGRHALGEDGPPVTPTAAG